MGKQTFSRFPLLMGLWAVIGLAVWGIASTVTPVSATETRPTESPRLAALPAQLQSTPTSTATVHSIPSVIIVSPADDQTFTFGELIPVVSKSADPQGITRLDLRVNNKLTARISNMKPQTNQTRTASLVWQPEIVGSQVLQVIAYNAAGITGESELVFVQILPAPTATPAPTPTATSTPTPAYPYVVITSADSLRVRSGPGTEYDSLGSLLPQQQARITGRNGLGADLWWQINFPLGTEGVGWIFGDPQYAVAHHTDNVPVVEAPPLPTPTASPTPSSGIDFRVDRTEIQQGECVTFTWNVYGVQAVYFQGKGVPGDNQSRRECPPKSTTYSLRVDRADGTTETQDIQINVSDPNASYVTTTARREAKIDFDNGAQSSEQDNEFFWYFDGDRPVFEKADDDNDLKLAALQPGSLDEFQSLNQDTCRSVLEQQDQFNITISLNLMVCFSTGEERMGKLRFTGGNRDELIMQWHLW